MPKRRGRSRSSAASPSAVDAVAAGVTVARPGRRPAPRPSATGCRRCPGRRRGGRCRRRRRCTRTGQTPSAAHENAQAGWCGEKQPRPSGERQQQPRSAGSAGDLRTATPASRARRRPRPAGAIATAGSGRRRAWRRARRTSPPRAAATADADERDLGVAVVARAVGHRLLVLVRDRRVLQGRAGGRVAVVDQAVDVALVRARLGGEERRGAEQQHGDARGDDGGDVVAVPARSPGCGRRGWGARRRPRASAACGRRPAGRVQSRRAAAAAPNSPSSPAVVGAAGVAAAGAARGREPRQPLLDVGAVGGVGRLAQVAAVAVDRLGGRAGLLLGLADVDQERRDRARSRSRPSRPSRRRARRRPRARASPRRRGAARRPSASAPASRRARSSAARI